MNYIWNSLWSKCIIHYKQINTNSCQNWLKYWSNIVHFRYQKSHQKLIPKMCNVGIQNRSKSVLRHSWSTLGRSTSALRLKRGSKMDPASSQRSLGPPKCPPWGASGHQNESQRPLFELQEAIKSIKSCKIDNWYKLIYYKSNQSDNLYIFIEHRSSFVLSNQRIDRSRNQPGKDVTVSSNKEQENSWR